MGKVKARALDKDRMWSKVAFLLPTSPLLWLVITVFTVFRVVTVFKALGVRHRVARQVGDRTGDKGGRGGERAVISLGIYNMWLPG